ncbi:hypothetical protein DFH94DRAFT_761713 [Russula ochroleuca]|uniref:Uncharacterized protein n=1 Tax=Russula ochroleuca TaxID=152965 RepID=A0A9P5JZT5_9AGAM|nr:hypothetical protein DFH94DRAFT_761713 [Russula ochroleuca]
MPVDTLAPFNVYRDQLATLSHGLALWNPNPPKEFYDNVSIGDVGYLHEGTFIRMFNVMLPWDDPSNGKLGVPDPYEPLDCGRFANTMERNFDRVDHYSRYVSAETNSSYTQAMNPDDAEGVTYKFRNRGALLSLPNGGRRKDVIRTKAFEDYIRDHVVSWYTWAQNNKLGVERMEDLILVSSCMLVTSWAAATFVENTMEARISLASRPFNNGAATFVWTNNQGPVVYHNSQFDPLNPPRTPDQCVFIKGFRAKRTFFRIRHLRAAAGPRPDDPDNRRDDDIQVTRVPGASKVGGRI